MLIVKSSLAVALMLGIGLAAGPAAAETKTLNVVERATTDAVRCGNAMRRGVQRTTWEKPTC